MLDVPWSDSLRQRFLVLWQRSLTATAEGAEEVWQVLLQGYGEAHRRYHGPGHIRFCLQQHDRAAPQMAIPDEVELAIWFHDIVHRPGSATNECDSAALFRRIAGPRASPRIDRVAAKILDTTHAHEPSDDDARFLVDIDLASLGQPWSRFADDSRRIREEQAHLSDAAYFAAQQTFLQSLFDRPRIYLTAFFGARYERRARANIERVLNSRAA